MLFINGSLQYSVLKNTQTGLTQSTISLPHPPLLPSCPPPLRPAPGPCGEPTINNKKYTRKETNDVLR